MKQLISFGSDLMLLMNLLTVILPATLAVDPYCNYQQQMDVGATYYVYNKEYPGYYGPNQDCRWIAVAPKGYVVKASCQLEMPNSSGCLDDRLLISRTGNPNLENAEVLCGYGNKTITTEGNQISIGLQSSYASKGGRFLCSIQAKQNVPPQCDCGWRNMRRIVGGVETKVNEYPSMAGLVDFQQRDVFCGGAIISHRYVLTAAHCLPNRQPSNTGVLVGDHNLTSGAETSTSSLHKATRFILHPNYNEKNAQNDVAIVETESVIEFSWAVGPICLPFYYYQYSFDGQIVTALGWGTTEFTGPPSDVLLKTDLDVLGYQECYISVNGTVDQLCTYSQGHDSCQKDSGGPILWTDDSTYRLFLVGIISNGYGCASSKPAINTRVTSYLSWIMSSIPNADICIKGPSKY